MIDVADLSMFRLLQTPSKAAKPSAAVAVARAAEAKTLVLKRPFAQQEGHSTVQVLGAQPRVHQRLHAQVSRLDQGGRGQDYSALAEARIAGHEAVTTLDGILTVALQRMASRHKHHF